MTCWVALEVEVRTGRRVYSYRTGTADAAGFDEYEDIFGAGSRTSAPAADTEAAIALTFSEAFHGVQKRLQLDDETINVRIPPGAKPGSRIRVKGKGRPSPFSQARGDLYLTIELLPHPFFRFEGDDILTLPNLKVWGFLLHPSSLELLLIPCLDTSTSAHSRPTAFEMIYLIVCSSFLHYVARS